MLIRQLSDVLHYLFPNSPFDHLSKNADHVIHWSQNINEILQPFQLESILNDGGFSFNELRKDDLNNWIDFLLWLLQLKLVSVSNQNIQYFKHIPALLIFLDGDIIDGLNYLFHWYLFQLINALQSIHQDRLRFSVAKNVLFKMEISQIVC